MMGYEQILYKDSSDICLVVGDVTSTMACSIVAKKEGLKVAHVEADGFPCTYQDDGGHNQVFVFQPEDLSAQSQV